MATYPTRPKDERDAWWLSYLAKVRAVRRQRWVELASGTLGIVAVTLGAVALSRMARTELGDTPVVRGGAVLVLVLGGAQWLGVGVLTSRIADSWREADRELDRLRDERLAWFRETWGHEP